MKETVYVEQPHGFEEPKGTSCARVCHLLRALYGLKQSPREWYWTLVDYLKSLGYERLECYKNNLLITMITGNLDTLYVCAWSAAPCSPLRRSLDRLHHCQASPLSISSTWVNIQLDMAFHSA